MRYLRYNSATIVTVGPFLDKTDGVTLETGLTITNERISFTVDLNDGSAPTLVLDNVTGATSGTSNDLNYITNNDAGLMQLELAAANVNYLGRAFLTITDAANHCPVFHEFTILPAMVYDSLIAGTDVLQADMTQILGTAVSAPATAGILDVNLKNIANAAVATGTAQLGVNVVTQANIDFGATQKASITTAASAATPALSAGGVTAVQSGLATAAALTVIDDFLDTEVAAILAAVDTEVAAIKTKTDYLPSATAGSAGGVFIAGANAATSVTTALTANITGNVSGSVGSVTGAVGSVTGAVGSVTGNVGGNVAGSVASVTGNVGGSVASVGANGITATSIAADAINAAAVKADAVTKIQTGLATPTNITAGTITTATNLTNLPAAAALEATLTAMKGATFSGATDSLEALRDRGDAAWITATGFATAANLATLAGYVDTEVASILAAVDTEVAAILADTNELQTDLVNGGRLDLLIDAIKAKSDNLPSDPADQSAVEAAITAATSPLATAAALATVAGYVDTEVASILAAVDTEVAALIATVGVAGAGLTALATQASVNDIPTNAELATALGTADDATLAAIAALNNLSSAQAQAAATAALNAYDPPTNAEMEARTLVAANYATAAALTAVDDYVDAEVAAIKAVTDKIDTALVLDGAVYQLTANALELAPTGGGGTADWTTDEREQIRYRLQLDGTQTVPTDTDLPSVNVTYSAGVALAGRLAEVTDLPAAAPSAATNATAAAAAILATPAYKIATLSGGEIVISPETVVAAYLTSASSEGQQLIADAANNLAPASTGATGSIRAKLDAIKLITDAIDSSAVTVTSSNNAGVLTFTRGVTFAATVSGLTISATWTKLYFTLKESDYDTDDMALLQLVETNPGAGTDGLLYLNSLAIASPITVADGTLTVSQAAGIVAIAITDNAMAALSKASGLVWDIKTKDAAGATVQNATGTASIGRAITQTI